MQFINILPKLRDRSDGKDKNALSAAILKAVRTFEPRIKEPKVYILPSDLSGRSIRFQIQGRISYETIQEEIRFDTVLELANGEFEIK